MAVRRPSSIAGFDERVDRHLHAGPGEAAPPAARARGLRRPRTMSASTQSSSRPCTRTCSTSSTAMPALGQRGEEPLGDARAVLPAHRHQERGERRRSGHRTAPTSFSVDPAACPRTQRLHDARRHAGDHAAVRDLATHHGTGGHHDVLADLRPGEDDGVGTQPAARADAHRRLGRPLPADRLDRVDRRCGSGP